MALPATLLLAFGAASVARAGLRPGDARRRLALGFLLTVGWAVALAFTTLTYELALFAQAKAPYGLMLVTPAALCFACGTARLDAWLARRAPAWARALLAGWLFLFAAVLLLGFAG